MNCTEVTVGHISPSLNEKIDILTLHDNSSIFLISGGTFRGFETAIPLRARDFFWYLQENYEDGDVILSEDEAKIHFYELHGIILDVGIYVLNCFIVPTFVALLASYIDRKVVEKNRNRKNEIEIRCKLIVEHKSERISVSYAGPPENISDISKKLQEKGVIFEKHV